MKTLKTLLLAVACVVAAGTVAAQAAPGDYPEWAVSAFSHLGSGE
jgi:hypothetical protein